LRRAHIINGLLFIGLGSILLLSALLAAADWPLIITVLSAVGIAVPLQFKKSLPADVARDLSQGKIIAVYGFRYWSLFALASILAIIGTLVIHAFNPFSDFGIIVASMGVMAIMMAFVNPRYKKLDDPSIFE